MEVSTIVEHVLATAISVVCTVASTAFVVGRKLGAMQEREKQKEKELEAQTKGWRLEFDDFRGDFDEHVRKDENQHEKFREQYVQAAQEASEQWRTTERTLGQIEGTLKARLPKRQL